MTDRVADNRTSEAERLAAYRECQKRGHTPSGLTLASNPPWSVCKFCGTNFRYEQVLVEGYNAPKEQD